MHQSSAADVQEDAQHSVVLVRELFDDEVEGVQTSSPAAAGHFGELHERPDVRAPIHESSIEVEVSLARSTSSSSSPTRTPAAFRWAFEAPPPGSPTFRSMSREQHRADSPRTSRAVEGQRTSRAVEGKSPDYADLALTSHIRQELVSAVFSELDITKRGALGIFDLRVFARIWGFQGSDHEWRLEFNDVCRHLGCLVEQGIDAHTFSRMVNDTSVKGCYCSDADLQWLQEGLKFQL
mmetsp:Transcript_5031/g.16352  ORF Transcript_5031/g.16352 Transcript_5031/m.16352 type:complete len:237 (+) Transcript_5031:1630-2340(+)